MNTLTLLLALATSHPAVLDDSFSFSGLLRHNGDPRTEPADLQFCLFDGQDPLAATNLGCNTREDVSFTKGIFTVRLNFGSVPVDQPRWIEIGVRPGTDVGPYETLSPLTPMGAAPQALFAMDAGSLEGYLATDFALSDHVHASLAPGSGLAGGVYNGDGSTTWSVNFGSGPDQAAPGDAGLTVSAGDGLMGGFADDKIGDGVTGTLSLKPGAGIAADATGTHVNTDSTTTRINAGNALEVIPGAGLTTEMGALDVAVDNTTIGVNAMNQLTLLGGNSGEDFGSVAVVSPSGGDYTDPQLALGDAANWCLPGGQCLLLVMPGKYNLTAPLEMQSNIAVTGMHQRAVILAGSDTGAGSGVVDTSGCQTECVLESLRIEATDNDGLGETNGLYIGGGGSVRMTDVFVDLDAKAGAAVRIENTDATLRKVTLSAQGEAAHALNATGDGTNTLAMNDCVLHTDVLEAGSGSVGVGVLFESMQVATSRCTITASGTPEVLYNARLTMSSIVDTDSEFALDLPGIGIGLHMQGCADMPSRFNGSKIRGPFIGLYAEACVDRPVNLHDADIATFGDRPFRTAVYLIGAIGSITDSRISTGPEPEGYAVVYSRESDQDLASLSVAHSVLQASGGITSTDGPAYIELQFSRLEGPVTDTSTTVCTAVSVPLDFNNPGPQTLIFHGQCP